MDPDNYAVFSCSLDQQEHNMEWKDKISIMSVQFTFDFRSCVVCTQQQEDEKIGSVILSWWKF